jgi:hypothetical protein
MDFFLQTFLDKGWLANLPPHPWAVVEQFIREVANGNASKILSLLPASLVAQLGSSKLETIFATNTEEVKNKGGIVDIEIENEWEDYENAAVDVSMTYGDGTTDTEVILLVKENSLWKIDLTR